MRLKDISLPDISCFLYELGYIINLLLMSMFKIFLWLFFWPFLIPYYLIVGTGTKCPKCGKKNINKVKAKSWLTSALRGQYFHELFHRSRDLFVCKDCGFSWEAR